VIAVTGRRAWTVVGGAAALAFLAGVGAGLAPQAPAAAPTASPARPSRGPVRIVHTPEPDVLAELARPQQPEDVPIMPVGHRLRASTFRVIDSSVLSYLYVARDVDGRICLVAMPVDDQFAAACGTDPKGLQTPLLLLYTVIPPGQGPVAALAGVDATE
jgi:hypothetical protein